MFKNLPQHNKIAFYTNLMYFYPAFTLLATQVLSPLVVLVAISFCALAIGSGYYHYYEKHEFAFPDWAAMFLVFSSLIVWTFTKITSEPLSAFLQYLMVLGLFVVSVKVYLYSKYSAFKYSGFIAIGLLFTVLAVAGYYPQYGSPAKQTTFLIAMAAAFVVRQYGEKYKYSSPSGLYLHDFLHGIWHVLTALGFTIYVS